MIILPIKRKNFIDGIPNKSFIFTKGLFALIASLIISVILIKNEAQLFDFIK
jgi:hypothetical protein